MRILPLLVLLCSGGAAQQLDLGVLAGGGGVSTGGPLVGVGQVGVEACLLCSGRFGIFAEYAHWFGARGSALENPRDLVRRMVLGGAGLRIQGRGKVRPFLDVGIVGGRDAHRDGRRSPLIGLVVGGGLRVPLGSHWFVRPQVRAYGLSPHSLEGFDAHFALSGGAGIGYSW